MSMETRIRDKLNAALAPERLEFLTRARCMPAITDRRVPARAISVYASSPRALQA